MNDRKKERTKIIKEKERKNEKEKKKRYNQKVWTIGKDR